MRPTPDFATLYDHVSDAVYVVDKHRKIVYFNPIAERISGFSTQEIVGSHCFDNLLNHIDEQGKRLCLFGCPLQDSIDRKVKNQADVYLHHKEGHRVKVRVTTLPYEQDQEYGIEIFHDAGARSISQLHRELVEQRQLQKLDELTRLMNRRHLSELLDGTVSVFDERPSAVFFLDIDNFKHFNDTYGHDLGDRVLASVSNTIRHNIRTTDHAIRYGGEELVVLLHHVSSEDALRLAENLRMLVDATSIRHKGENLHVTVSIGVSFFQEQRHLKQAIEEADQAMLLAKRSGKNMVRVLEQTEKQSSKYTAGLHQ